MHLKSCIDEAVHLLQLNKNAKQVNYQNHCPGTHYVIADAQRLLQVFVNLLSNARDASPEFSPITVDCKVADTIIYVSVTDQGSGISREHQEQIFDPFFTTKEAGEGTGLGLSLVYTIIEELNGHISVESPINDSDAGTRFTIRLERQMAD